MLSDLGVGTVRFFPGRRSDDLPPVGRSTRFVLAQPFLGETARALEARGAALIPSPFPFGVEGTWRWLESIAAAFGIDPARVQDVASTAAERGRRALERYRPQLQGKRITFLPDSQLEIPMARFLARECGMQLVEVGTPYLDRRLMQAELDLMPTPARLSEGQDVERQLDRLHEDAPDLTVCGLGLANPLEARGRRTKWSIELVFSPVHGFEQAADLAELFARPLARGQRLEV